MCKYFCKEPCKRYVYKAEEVGELRHFETFLGMIDICNKVL